MSFTLQIQCANLDEAERIIALIEAKPAESATGERVAPPAEAEGLDAVVVQQRDDGSLVRTVAHPITYTRTPARYVLPPPALGEHDDELRAWLSSALDA